MAIITDQELTSKLLQGTIEGRIPWEKTEVDLQFAAKYAGKWTLTIDKSHPDDPDDHYWLALSNEEGEEILKILSSQEARLDELFELARRYALKVDEALKDILKEIDPDHGKEITDEDIPF